MSVTRPVSNIEELLALPEDGLRHELLDGEHVVTPVPAYAHRFVLGELFATLYESLLKRNDLRVMPSPADVHLGLERWSSRICSS